MLIPPDTQLNTLLRIPGGGNWLVTREPQALFTVKHDQLLVRTVG